MRRALPLLAMLVAFGIVGCGGDKKTSPPPPVAQRFLTAADAPGSKPDPVEKRGTTKNFDTFLAALGDSSINPNRVEMTKVFDDAAFVSAGQDARFFGKTHSPQTSVHVFSSFIELRSKDAAKSALDWLETDQMKPCPKTCAVRISSFEIDHVPDGRGVHRVATAQDIDSAGTQDEQPQDDYWIGFAVGPIVYVVVLHGHAVPGTVSEAQAQEIASAYYDRLTS